jgi:hypothetical protein
VPIITWGIETSPRLTEGLLAGACVGVTCEPSPAANTGGIITHDDQDPIFDPASPPEPNPSSEVEEKGMGAGGIAGIAAGALAAIAGAIGAAWTWIQKKAGAAVGNASR